MRFLPALPQLSSIFFLACGGSGASLAPAPAPGEATAPAEPVAEPIFPAPFRLPDTVVPRSYELSLRIDPAAKTFSGQARIEVQLAASARLLRMHADGLSILGAAALVDGRSVALEARTEGGNLALLAASPLPAGALELTLSWQGPLPETPVGIYRVQDGGRWYAYTQFEPLEARRAFPSFDEPRFKAPFTLTIDVPAGLSAFSNAPARSPPAPVEAGWTRFSFEPTPPLPTYLVAFIVGDFDVVEGGTISRARVPLRVITPKGKGRLASFVIDRTPRYIEALEAWFGTPYPFAKLDLVAVPNFSSGAMENAGLITFREARLLIDGEHASIDERLWCEGVLSHELAHMWFGDLVTTAWWDDIWLNEAFATWMSRKVMAVVAPELEISEQALRGTLRVMQLDAQPSARAVRQPIADNGDVYNAFDGITYTKGAAVLSMVEQWIGPLSFQEGVRAYLAEHAHGNATTADLLAHLGRAGERDVASMVATFVDQPGVPLVTLDWRCEPDGVVAVELAQTPYRLLGDTRASAGETWRVPVCARLSDGKQDLDHCALLTEPKATWRLNAGFCPSFAHPNVAEAGYYLWDTPLGPISVARRDDAAFAGYVASLRAGIESGRLPLAKLLDGVEPLIEASVSPSELGDLVGALMQVVRFDPDAPRDARFRKKARALLDRIPLDLGLGDSPRERRRMPILVRALALMAHDARVLARAQKVTGAFLDGLEGKGKAKVSSEDVTIYLPLHVVGLGREPKDQGRREALWKRLRAALDEPLDPSERELVIGALAAFDDPALVTRSYDLALDGTLLAQDLRTLRASTLQTREVTRAVWTWFTSHFDAVIARLGPKSAPGLPSVAAAFCDNGAADEVEAFFKAHAGSVAGGIERPLAQTLETIRACAVGRARYGDEARRWYAGR